jgi:hypothetical protein
MDSANFGPAFGGSDFVIHNHSNTNYESFSNFADNYERPFGMSNEDACLYLAGSAYFKVNEIEVYELE